MRFFLKVRNFVRNMTTDWKGYYGLPLERQTEPSGNVTLYSILADQLGYIQNEIPVEFYDVIEHLIKYNPDFGYVTENIIQLANTDTTTTFNDDVDDKVGAEMIKLLNSDREKWYKHSGGLASLRSDLLMQICIYGALSGEMIPTISLDGIEDIVTVKPSTIVFRYDKELGRYIPYQKRRDGTLLRLNVETFKYYTLRRTDDKPYPIPPFLTALENVIIEKDMVGNIKEIVKNLGVLGFLQVLIRPPKSLPGNTETEDQYTSRAQKLLDQATVTIKEGMSNGYLVGFKEEHEIEMKSPSTGGNAQGVAELMRINTEQKLSGLKQSPFMVGRNYSTTETLGKVIITVLGSQVKSHQLIVDRFISDVMKMHLYLKNYDVDYVKVKSKKPLITDEAKEQVTRKQKIDNEIKLYEQGLISQGTLARNLDLDEPDLPGPREVFDDDDGNLKQDEEIDETNIDVAASILNPNDIIEFEYSSEHLIDYDHAGEFDYPKQPKLNKYFKSYFADTKSIYNDSISKFLKRYVAFLNKTNLSDTSPVKLTNRALYMLYKDWGQDFTTRELAIINKWTKKAYKDFRSDMLTVFGKKVNPAGDALPEGILGLKDYRAMEYFGEVDAIYLGKFITDASTKNKITAFIKEEYLNKGLSAGDKKSIEAFKNRFGTLLKAEDWKIKSILKTSVNRMRNTASIYYMDQAKVTKFIIQGISDQLQCAYCEGMQGKIFKIEKTIKKLDKVAENGADDLSAAPFITSVFGKMMKGKSRDEIVASIKGMTEKHIQDMNIDSPPYHCHCRCVVVAVFD